jgi:hypothetical protein
MDINQLDGKTKQKLMGAISEKLKGAIEGNLKDNKIKFPINDASNGIESSEFKKLEGEIKNINQELIAIRSHLESFNSNLGAALNNYEKEGTISLSRRLAVLEKEISEIKQLVLYLA